VRTGISLSPKWSKTTAAARWGDRAPGADCPPFGKCCRSTTLPPVRPPRAARRCGRLLGRNALVSAGFAVHNYFRLFFLVRSGGKRETYAKSPHMLRIRFCALSCYFSIKIRSRLIAHRCDIRSTRVSGNGQSRSSPYPGPSGWWVSLLVSPDRKARPRN